MGRREFAKQLATGTVLSVHMYGKLAFMAADLHKRKPR